MSQVTLCDFCAATSRTSGETVKLELPRNMAPEALHSVTSPGSATVKLDVCRGCEGEIAAALDEIIGRRFGATPPTGEAHS